MGANYAIYIEDYVLSYLKLKVDSLELSEIFFYGRREDGGRKLLVYGAGRKKAMEVFAEYEPLEELVCRLTQAGPVFMVREKNGDYKVSGFRTFYEENEAMQDYLLAWTGSGGKRQAEEEPERKRLSQRAFMTNRENGNMRGDAEIETFPREEEKHAGTAMSAQLGLIFVILVAIVISSTNSYDKMQQLGQSAKEVFFAIENQEVQDEASEEKKTEIVVERDTGERSVVFSAEKTDVGEEEEESVSEEDAKTEESEGAASGEEPQTEKTTSSAADEGGQEEAVSDENEDAGTEALSRNVTRYYEVEQGDTLYTISQEIYGDSSRVEKICELNQISDPDKIQSGQKIILP